MRSEIARARTDGNLVSAAALTSILTAIYEAKRLNPRASFREIFLALLDKYELDNAKVLDSFYSTSLSVTGQKE